MVRISPWACSTVTPGFIRAVRLRNSLVRFSSVSWSGRNTIGAQISTFRLKKSRKPLGMTPTTW